MLFWWFEEHNNCWKVSVGFLYTVKFNLCSPFLFDVSLKLIVRSKKLHIFDFSEMIRFKFLKKVGRIEISKLLRVIMKMSSINLT